MSLVRKTVTVEEEELKNGEVVKRITTTTEEEYGDSYSTYPVYPVYPWQNPIVYNTNIKDSNPYTTGSVTVTSYYPGGQINW